MLMNKIGRGYENRNLNFVMGRQLNAKNGKCQKKARKGKFE